MSEEFDTTGIEIDLGDIFLRAYDEHDLEDYFAYAKVEGINENSGKKHFETIGEAKKIEEKFLTDGNVFSIVDKNSGRMFGIFGVYNIKENLQTKLDSVLGKKKGVDISYEISKDYWGKGNMTRILSAMIDYIFNHTDIEMIIAAHYDFNEASDRVQKKNNMKYIFDFVGTDVLGNRASGKFNYILREDYFADTSGL